METGHPSQQTISQRFLKWKAILAMTPLIVIILGILLIICLVALLMFTPFLIMSNADQLSYKYNANE
ncbi:hypothetical protein, partial [Mycobacterium tuberculosis]|uniref:hypothetical protein n=1 Tax=Mycobacterium tuberculosis TaxID=1773 RepID=UPI001BE0BA56